MPKKQSMIAPDYLAYQEVQCGHELGLYVGILVKHYPVQVVRKTLASAVGDAAAWKEFQRIESANEEMIRAAMSSGMEKKSAAAPRRSSNQGKKPR